MGGGTVDTANHPSRLTTNYAVTLPYTYSQARLFILYRIPQQTQHADWDCNNTTPTTLARPASNRKSDDDDVMMSRSEVPSLFSRSGAACGCLAGA